MEIYLKLQSVSIPYSTIKIASCPRPAAGSCVSIPYSTIKILVLEVVWVKRSTFQFLIVRLKLPSQTVSTSVSMFQFLIVRLKSNWVKGLTSAREFQFLIVRLKSGRWMWGADASSVSIPYSTIKIIRGCTAAMRHCCFNSL